MTGEGIMTAEGTRMGVEGANPLAALSYRVWVAAEDDGSSGFDLYAGCMSP